MYFWEPVENGGSVLVLEATVEVELLSRRERAVIVFNESF